MKKNRLRSFWQMSFALLFTFSAFQMQAAEELHFTGVTTSGANNTLTLDIEIQDFDLIASFQFTLRWNKDILSFTDLNNYGLPFMGPEDFGTNNGQPEDGFVTVSWFDGNTTGITQPDGTVIFSVEFDVLTSGDPEFAIEDCPTSIEVVNGNFELLDLYFNGTIAGGCNGSGGNPSSVSDWVIEFPADMTVDWPATPDQTGYPEIFFEDDELIAITYQDVVLNTVPGFDAKIIRTWKAINWEEVEPNLANSIVEVPENQLAAPNDDLNNDGESNTRTFRDSWDGVGFPNEVGDNWDGFIEYTQVIWVNENSGPCGTDTEPPTPFCLSNLSVVIDPTTASINVWAADFDAGSFDNCTDDLIFSFSNVVSNQMMTVTADDIGSQSVSIWVTDNAGNQDFCNTNLHVSDTPPVGDLSITGFILRPEGTPLEAVEVTCAYGNITTTTMTNGDGFYEITDLPEGESFLITALKPSSDYESDVTSFDIAKLGCIILGLELPGTHHIMASDVNGSLGATTFDLVLMNKMILGLLDEFSVPVWRFVSDFGTPDPWNIINASFQIELPNLTESAHNQNFTAVKAGDLVPETNPNPAYQPSFDLLETNSGDPNIVEVEVVVENFENFTATQFALEWDQSILEYESFEVVANPPVGNSLWTDANMTDDILRVVVRDPSMLGSFSLQNGETLMRFTFNVLQLGTTEISFVDDAIFPKLVIVNGCDLAGGVFNFTNAPIDLLNTATTDYSTSGWSAQVSPNIAKTNEEITLNVTDNIGRSFTQTLINATGQIMWSAPLNGQFGQREHRFIAPSSSGLYFLQIADNEGNKKVIKLIVQ